MSAAEDAIRAELFEAIDPGRWDYLEAIPEPDAVSNWLEEKSGGDYEEALRITTHFAAKAIEIQNRLKAFRKIAGEMIEQIEGRLAAEEARAETDQDWPERVVQQFFNLYPPTSKRKSMWLPTPGLEIAEESTQRKTAINPDALLAYYRAHRMVQGNPAVKIAVGLDGREARKDVEYREDGTTLIKSTGQVVDSVTYTDLGGNEVTAPIMRVTRPKGKQVVIRQYSTTGEDTDGASDEGQADDSD
jgi:hypothetical protein